MPKVISEKLLTIAELLEILEKIQEERELTSIEAYTLDYAKKFAKIPADSARKAVRELVELGVPEPYAVQIVNIMPRTEDELRVILAPLMKPFTPSALKKILEILDRYRREVQ